jgi:SAM-dependent methyltransferase
MATRDVITRYYGDIAVTGSGCCGGSETLSLGTGDVVGAARLRAGERVLDLGSGPGTDALAAAEIVGSEGRVEGLDLTPAMVERASRGAAGRTNVAFRTGDIAALPFADASFDVVLTNCVINLVEDKPAVFREARRVLRPGGRLVLSDVVFVSGPSPEVRRDERLACACIGGAALLAEYLEWLREVGLGDLEIVEGRPYARYGEAQALAVTLVAREGAGAVSCC